MFYFIFQENDIRKLEQKINCGQVEELIIQVLNAPFYFVWWPGVVFQNLMSTILGRKWIEMRQESKRAQTLGTSRVEGTPRSMEVAPLENASLSLLMP